MRYEFIRQQQKAYPIALLCQVMEVSRSGFYRYLKMNHNLKSYNDFELLSRVRQIHSDTRGAYGSRRIAEALRSKGYDIGRYRARNLMKKAGVSVRHRKKFKKTTDSKHHFPIAPNLLDRNFQVDKPDKVWCSDISYLWTIEGWLYLAVVIDLYARKVVGWAIDRRLDATLVKEAFLMAYWRRNPAKGLIHHSDRGTQYACHDYQDLLREFGMICSMSRKGDCWDNAVAESFFHSLKTEWTADFIYQTRDEARNDVIRYIEIFYNSHRLHSFLGYRNPNAFEEDFLTAKAA